MVGRILGILIASVVFAGGCTLLALVAKMLDFPGMAQALVVMALALLGLGFILLGVFIVKDTLSDRVEF